MSKKGDAKVWAGVNLKPEDAEILDKISEDTGKKKYALVRDMLRNCYPNYCTNSS